MKKLIAAMVIGLSVVSCAGGGSEDSAVINDEDAPKCYQFVRSYMPRVYGQPSIVVDPRNNSGIDEDYVVSSVEASVAIWGSALDAPVYGSVIRGEVERETFGFLSNGVNEVAFVPAIPGGHLAVTYLWYRKDTIVEFDMLISEEHPWGTDGGLDSYDFDSIIMHEVGHAQGLGHPEGDGCENTTMFISFGLGDSYRRMPSSSDYEGLRKLYL